MILDREVTQPFEGKAWGLREIYKLSNFQKNQGMPFPLPPSKYNILNQLANIKVDATLLDMVVIPEQKKHLKNFMEGKVSTIANHFEESKEEDSNVNKIGVNNVRKPIKKFPFLYFCKNYG
jgi:hypothetical protein